jgi:hypothetical protein
MKYSRSLTAVLMIFFLTCGIFAQNDSALFSTKFSGFGSFEVGQIVRGISTNASGSLQNMSEPSDQKLDLNKIWLERALMGINLTAASRSGKARVVLEGIGDLSFSYLTSLSFADPSTPPSRLLGYDFYVSRAYGDYTLGDSSGLFGRFCAGYFPYKYNKDAANLGEYLFRSRTNIPYIYNTFDLPLKPLLGLRITNGFGEIFSQDMMLTSETTMLPFGDFSLSYVADATPAKLIDIGAGVCFDHLISVNHNVSSRKDLGNIYKIDSVTHDTSYYPTFGTKVMAHLSLDPKAFFECRWFNKPDLRIWAEANILGIKNYSPFYDRVTQRLPFDFGINVPTFKALDLLALEFEFYDNPYMNSWLNVMQKDYPQPNTNLDDPMAKVGKWCWSLYAKRSFGEIFTVTFQVAKDHMVPTYRVERDIETSDVLNKGSHWWWTAKIQAGF